MQLKLSFCWGKILVLLLMVIFFIPCRTTKESRNPNQRGEAADTGSEGQVVTHSYSQGLHRVKVCVHRVIEISPLSNASFELSSPFDSFENNINFSVIL